jgi:hypothetical protein
MHVREEWHDSSGLYVVEKAKFAVAEKARTIILQTEFVSGNSGSQRADERL